MKNLCLSICLAAVASLALAEVAEAQGCQPGPWQECMEYERECAQCGQDCADMVGGPCWYANACWSGYYVYDRWQEVKGVDCDFTGAFQCYLYQTYTEYYVSEVRHETWERRECYNGPGGLYTVMTGYYSTYPISAWRKGGYCSPVNPKPSPVIMDCI